MFRLIAILAEEYTYIHTVG